MDGLRQPGESDYDVLGVSPEATDEEISSAFCQLIYEQGYRVGVPRELQWERAREITAAHATLGDPVKRRAYDESLGLPSDPARWVATADDAATDVPILPDIEPEEAEPPRWAATADDAATDNLVLPVIDPEEAEPVENISTPDAVLVPDLDERELTDTEPEQALDTEFEAEAEEEVWFVHNRPPPPYLAPTPSENERGSARIWDRPAAVALDRPSAGTWDRASGGSWGRGSVRNWGLATAAALGLGLVLLSYWPEWNGQPSTSERPPVASAHPGQVSGVGPGLGHYSPQEPGNPNGAATSAPGVQGAPPGDLPAASATLGGPLESRRAGDEGTTQEVDELAPTDTVATQSGDITPTGAPPTGGPSSAPAEAAETQATASAPTPPAAASPPIATAPQQVTTAPAINRAPVRAVRPRNLARSSPQWLGGGPTDADNVRGRYQGSVAVRVTVEPGGGVSSCVPVRGSGNAGLDAMTCRLVQERARFNPALDAQGRPVASQAYTTIVWRRGRRK